MSQIKVVPLGAGQDVGKSCILVRTPPAALQTCSGNLLAAMCAGMVEPAKNLQQILGGHCIALVHLGRTECMSGLGPRR